MTKPGETWHAEDLRQFAERSGLKFLDRWRRWAGVGGVSLVESQRTEKPTPSEVALVLGYMRGQELLKFRSGNDRAAGANPARRFSGGGSELVARRHGASRRFDSFPPLAFQHAGLLPALVPPRCSHGGWGGFSGRNRSLFSSRTLVKMMAISYRGEAVGCSGGRPGPGSKGGSTELELEEIEITQTRPHGWAVLESGPHSHPICPECKAIKFGNISCATCRKACKTLKIIGAEGTRFV